MSWKQPNAISRKMLPPLQNQVGRKDKLIARSRERFAIHRAIIDAKLNRWMASTNLS
jgi:hypothetical protein